MITYQALCDDSVHAILVVTPTSTHPAIIQAGLAAGKHVFCEKPMAETEEGIKQYRLILNIQFLIIFYNVRACYDKADEVGRYLFCAFQRRFDPTFRDIYNRVRAGWLKKLRERVSLVSYLKVSGGVFKDALAHDFDLLTWICGELTTEVFVNGSNSFPEVNFLSQLFQFMRSKVFSFDKIW